MEITVKIERCFLTCLYRSPSQNCEQFQSFCDSLDILMNNINSLNPAILIITGDLNGKSSKWYSFDTITSTASYSQIIDKPTHFINNSSSCIDFIFPSNPSIMVDSGIEKSLCSSPAGTRRCDNVRFWLPFGRDVGQRQSNVVATLSFRHRCSDQNLTFLQCRVFDVDFPTRY